MRREPTVTERLSERADELSERADPHREVFARERQIGGGNLSRGRGSRILQEIARGGHRPAPKLARRFTVDLLERFALLLLTVRAPFGKCKLFGWR